MSTQDTHSHLHLASTPTGLCMCGCGAKTALAKSTDKRRGYVAGQPMRYVMGHGARGTKNAALPDYPWYFNSHRGRWYVRARRERSYRWARVLMENELGRELTRDEIVHHVNGDKADDRVENLQVLSRAEHNILHVAQGDSGWERAWLKKAGRFREINGIPFEAVNWFEDLKEVAKLYRWLDFLGEAPLDPARFIEEAFAYEQNYRDMLMWTGRAS